MAKDDAAKEDESATLLSDEDKTMSGEADMLEDKRPRVSVIEPLLTLAYCMAYLLVGPALILTNKQILKDVGFAYPMVVSGIGQFSSAVGAFVVIRVLKLQPLTQVHQVKWSFYVRNMGVVGAATAASLCFGNAGYLYLTVSFVQILKAFTPVFVVAMLFFTRVETPSRVMRAVFEAHAAGARRHLPFSLNTPRTHPAEKVLVSAHCSVSASRC